MRRERNKINIIIFPGYFLPHIGGLETHVDEFAKYLSLRDYSVTIFAPNIPKTSQYEIIHKNVRVIRYPAIEIVDGFPIPKFWTLTFWKMWKSLYYLDIDFVMTRTRFFFNSFLGVIFSKFRFSSRVLIHVEHGSEFVEVESKLVTVCSKLYDKTFGKLVFVMSNSIVAISQVSYDFVKREFVPYKDVKLIRRGVDFEAYEEIDEYKFSEFSDKIIFAWLGRLVKWKGVEHSIQAFKELPYEMREKCVFIIIGYGEDEVRLKQLAKDEKHIVFMGKQDFSVAISMLKSADVYVHSASPGGALSNSLLQAMYCECSVIASPNEGARDVVFNNKTGLLLKDNSVYNIKRGIEKMIQDSSLRKKLTKNAHEYIRDNFSWKRVIDKYEKEVFK
ncbi:MAG: glycosyltransferase family 4 protein [Candidatus Nanoarchaeia archaeon]